MAYKATTGIYKIENLINGKVYIGLSVNMKKRWKDHKKCINGVNFSEYDRPLYRAMRKYGIENFKFEVLEECSREELEKRESFYIEKYRSYERDFGYNISRGGETGALNKLTWEQVEEITELLKNSDLSQTQIGDLYGISSEMVNGMNTGRFYRRDIEYPIIDYKKKQKVTKGISQVKCLGCGKPIGRQSLRCLECQALSQRRSERPEKDELLEEVALYGFEAVGRQHGVSGNAVKKWMKSYGLPYLIKDVKILYGNYRPTTKD